MMERLPQNYTPLNYDFYMHITENQYPFDASVTITFQKNEDSDKLYLNVDPEIQIKKITQNKIDLTYTVDYPMLIIERSKDPDMDFITYPITIEYNVSPTEDDNEGFFVCNGNYLTDFEPTGARKLLPCFDEPCVRSTFSVKLLTPSYLTSISNMPIESINTKEIENEITFVKSPPMCTYLLCLCIGSFSSIVGSTDSGTMVEYFTSTGRENYLYRYLDVAIYALNWLESKFGVKYELPHLQLISLYGFPGGMENYGLITLNDYTRSSNFLYNKTVIMHEITHQWFGDLVCIKYWDSLWLNEGFAEFIQYLILRDYDSKLNASELFSQNDGLCCLNYFDYGVITPPESDVNFDTLFDSLVYSKGAFVLKMFFDMVGEESFVKVCSNYLNKFKNKCVEVNDFIDVANSTLNNDFTSFFNPWLRDVGFPVLNINEIEKDSQKVGITITQINQNDRLFKFKVPIIYEKNGEIKKIEVNIDDYFMQVDIEFDWVIVNDEMASLCYVIYSKNLMESLKKPKTERKISKLNKILINKSIDSHAVQFLIDEEMEQLLGEFNRS